MTDYFQKRSGLVGYSAGGSGYTDKLVTNMTLYGLPIMGSDAFWPVHNYDSKWYATLETGELRLVPDGQKATIYEVHLNTSIEDNSTYTKCPDAIVQMIGVGDASWNSGGDSNGTISVTTTGVTGTGTAWSNTIAEGDGSTVLFTTPAAAEKCRIYVGGTLKTVAAGDYSITTATTITFGTAPADNEDVVAYWTGHPSVSVGVGDYIETTQGLHRIQYVDNATHIRLDKYPTTTLSGTHLPAKELTVGETETVFGLRGVADRVRFKIYFIPKTHPFAVRYIKDISLSVVFTPSGTRQFEE